MQMLLRQAELKDCEEIADIYNQGIDERIATFEIAHRRKEDIEKWFDGIHPTVVCEVDGQVVAFATTSNYRYRECYNGIAEFSVYVKKESRGSGIGRSVLEKLIKEAEKMGYWKLVSRIFIENSSSRALMDKLGFREVGTYEKHGKLDGVWKDVVIVELLLPKNLK